MKENMRVSVYKAWHHDLASEIYVAVTNLFV